MPRTECTLESILETLPFDYSLPQASQLRDLLSEVYYRHQDIVSLADSARFPRSDIPFQDTARDTWHRFLSAARARDGLTAIIDIILSDERASAYHARIRELIAADPVVEYLNDEQIEEDLLLEPINPDDLELAERQTGDRPTLLDLSFLYGGLRVAPAVMRVIVRFRSMTCSATGFLVTNDIVLTNHHVLFEKNSNEPAQDIQVWLGYETGSNGRLKKPFVTHGLTDSIVGDRSLDWATFRLSRKVPKEFSPLPLSIKSPLTVGDGVCIIQHPNGMPKRIALQHNTVVSRNGHTVQYLTDTDEGSSGSPVFDESWRVVALHRGSDRLHVRGKSIIVNLGTDIRSVAIGLKDADIPITLS